MRIIFLSLILSSQLSYSKVKLETDANKMTNCGIVIAIQVRPAEVEVIYHPTNSAPLSKGGANRGEIFKKTDFDLGAVQAAALESLKSQNLLFCGGLESADKTRLEPGYVLSSSQRILSK